MNLVRKILTGASLAAMLLGSSALGNSEYPVYPDMKPKEHYESNIERSIEDVIGECDSEDYEKIEQSLYVNIPGFYIRLENKVDDQLCSSFTFPVRVGRHWEKHTRGETGKRHTPEGKGVITKKRFRVKKFTYGSDSGCKIVTKVYYKKLKINGKVIKIKKKKKVKRCKYKKGDPIEVSRTYTPEGDKITIPMPYDWIRSLGMRIFPEGKEKGIERCVIHSTTDAYTIGIPTSKCCLGLTIDEMLDLYALVIPEQRKGEAENEVKIHLVYKLVENDGEKLVLHTDIYEKGADYTALIRQELIKMGYSEELIDQERIDELVKEVEKQFASEYLNIRKKRVRKEFLTEEDKAKLHYWIKPEDLMMGSWIQFE